MDETKDHRFPDDLEPGRQERVFSGETQNGLLAKIAAMINISLAAFALWQLVVPGDYGLVLDWTTLTPGFVVFGAMAVITCVATTGMIRFPEKDIRWTGRLFICGLPAAFVILTGINALV